MNYNYINRNSNTSNNNRQSINRQSKQISNGISQSQQNKSSYIVQSKQQDVYKKYQQKLKALGRVRYKNQLAQLQYQQKLTQLHTKYTSKTKQSVQKKLRAKNQMAQFIDQQQQDFGQQFEQLMDFKYGTSKLKDFHYENQQNKQNYTFCSLCDQIYTGNEKDHQKICKYNELARTPLYYIQSLDRINKCLLKQTSQQANQLRIITQKIKRKQNVQKQLYDILPYVKNDDVLGKIVAKLKIIDQQIK